MRYRDEILARFRGSEPHEPFYLPDLTLWHKWHRERSTLPADWRDDSLAGAADALDVPAWVVHRPWEVQHSGINLVTAETAAERTISYETSFGVLTARWSLGPDGDWWQVEYPVKTIEDLPAARAVVVARTYVFDDSRLAELDLAIGESGVVALEIPMRPYSDLLHTMLGWGEGLMLFASEGQPILSAMIATLENKLQALVAEIARLRAPIVLAPDNLDGQYISPRVFREYLDASYRQTTGAVHAAGKYLVVHAGGPCRRILPLLAQAGVDGVEGIAGPPQGDLSLAEARQVAGPDITLWGGIPQDLLLPVHSEADFEAAVRRSARDAAGDGRMIVGVADRVPVNSDLARLRAIPGLLAVSSPVPPLHAPAG